MRHWYIIHLNPRVLQACRDISRRRDFVGEIRLGGRLLGRDGREVEQRQLPALTALHVQLVRATASGAAWRLSSVPTGNASRGSHGNGGIVGRTMAFPERHCRRGNAVVKWGCVAGVWNFHLPPVWELTSQFLPFVRTNFPITRAMEQGFSTCSNCFGAHPTYHYRRSFSYRVIHTRCTHFRVHASARPVMVARSSSVHEHESVAEEMRRCIDRRCRISNRQPSWFLGYYVLTMIMVLH